MTREDEICLTLQGLINGVDFETGEVVEFSDKVLDSLKVIAKMLECKERCQQLTNISESKPQPESDWKIVSGTFIKIKRKIKDDRPNHLVIIQNGYFYEVLNEDAIFFKGEFSYNTFERNGSTITGFPIHSNQVFQDLKDMEKSYVLVGQLPKGDASKIQRVIADIFDGSDGFYDKLTKNTQQFKKTSSEPLYSKTELKSVIGISTQKITRKELERKEKNSEINQKQKLELKAKIKALKKIEKLATPKNVNYNKSPQKTTYPKKIPKKVKPDFKQYIDEPLGSRDDFKSMSNKQFGTNSKTKF